MRSRVSAVVGAILLSLTTAAGATAGGPPSGGGDEGVQHSWLSCPEGTASSGSIAEIGIVRGNVVMRYTVTPCTTPTPTTAMAIGFYHPDGHADGVAHPYGAHAYSFAGVPAGALATCLLASPQARLDCYELVLPPNGEVTVGQRISTSDPRVAAIPEIELYLILLDDDDPTCPLCVI